MAVPINPAIYTGTELAFIDRNAKPKTNFVAQANLPMTYGQVVDLSREVAKHRNVINCERCVANTLWKAVYVIILIAGATMTLPFIIAAAPSVVFAAIIITGTVAAWVLAGLFAKYAHGRWMRMHTLNHEFNDAYNLTSFSRDFATNCGYGTPLPELTNRFKAEVSALRMTAQQWLDYRSKWLSQQIIQKNIEYTEKGLECNRKSLADVNGELEELRKMHFHSATAL